MKMSTEHPVISTKQQLSDEYVIFHKNVLISMCYHMYVFCFVCVYVAALSLENHSKYKHVTNAQRCAIVWIAGRVEIFSWFYIVMSVIFFSIQQSNAA